MVSTYRKRPFIGCQRVYNLSLISLGVTHPESPKGCLRGASCIKDSDAISRRVSS